LDFHAGWTSGNQQSHDDKVWI